MPRHEPKLHRDLESLREHMQRHLGVDRVLDVVRVAFPALSDFPVFSSSRALVRAARREPSHAEFCELVSGYQHMIDATVRHGDVLGWSVRTGSGALISFSPTGFLVVRQQGIVVSAFVAGMRDGPQELFDDAPRDFGLGADLPSDEAYFKMVVEPAIAMILRSPVTQRIGHPGEYGALMTCPGMRGIDFPAWLEACDQVGWIPLEVEP